MSSIELRVLEGNRQRLDGGAMFGNVPKALWSRWIPPDDLNRIELACRCLLARIGGRNFLFETGIGNFFDPALRDRYGVLEPGNRLLAQLDGAGMSPEDIDVVVLSHLHFDHAGGMLSGYEEGPARLVFPRAEVWVGARQWERATSPHLRDRVSFLPALHELLEASERLVLVDEATPPPDPVIGFTFSDGHTPGMMLSHIALQDTELVFAGDLVPGAAWVHLPVTMGYDRFPERLIDEKRHLEERLAAQGGHLFFTHDPRISCAQVCYNAQKKKFEPRETRLEALM